MYLITQVPFDCTDINQVGMYIIIDDATWYFKVHEMRKATAKTSYLGHSQALASYLTEQGTYFMPQECECETTEVCRRQKITEP